jgi:hypothetical protein
MIVNTLPKQYPDFARQSFECGEPQTMRVPSWQTAHCSAAPVIEIGELRQAAGTAGEGDSEFCPLLK